LGGGGGGGGGREGIFEGKAADTEGRGQRRGQRLTCKGFKNRDAAAAAAAADDDDDDNYARGRGQSSGIAGY